MWRRFMETKTVTVKFGGQVESVDVNTFTRVLLDYAGVLQASCKIDDPQAKIASNVRAVRPGCLEVDLSIIAEGIGGLFKDPETSMQTVANGIAIASGFYGLKKFLGRHGKAISAEDEPNGKSKITAQDGSTITVMGGVTNLYVNCPQVSESVSSSFDALDNDPRIESMSISSDGDVTFSADRSEFGMIASSPSYESTKTNTMEEDTTLTVVKPVLERSTTRKWEFVWRGTKVTANISDKKFMDRLDDELFGIGTSMDVRLKIAQEFDDGLKAFINKRYEVVRVYSVAPPPQTDSLF